MNKEDILAKSRKEKNDEGMMSTENKGRRIGISAFCCVFIFIVIFNVFNGRNSYAPMAMFWAFLSAEAYPKYQFSKNKWYLVTVIAGAIAAIASLISYVLFIVR